VDATWRLAGYQNPSWTNQSFDYAIAVVPDFKGSIANSRRSWKISGSNGDLATQWGFQQSALNTQFRFPSGDNDVLYSDVFDNECVYERATGFLPFDKITLSNLKPMDQVIVVDYPNSSYFNCGFYGWRNRDNLNTGLRGFILSEIFSEYGQVPSTRMGYVDGFHFYRTLIDVTIGKRSMSYEKLGGMISAAPAFTTIDLTFTGKLLTSFNGTPNIGFDYFEATWSKPGMAEWTVHGPGNGDPQTVAFSFKPIPDEVTAGYTSVDLSLLKLRQFRLTQYSQEFTYSDAFPVWKDSYTPSKSYEEVFKHVLTNE
jgi:hypothetical protein